MNIYDKIDIILCERKMSRRALAVLCDIKPSTFQTMMERRSGMTIETAQVIKDKLNLSASDFFENTGEKEQLEIEALILAIRNSIKKLAEEAENKGVYDVLFKETLVSPFSDKILDYNNKSIKRCHELLEQIDIFKDESGNLDGSKVLFFLGGD